MTLDRAGKTATLRTPDHVNHFAVSKLIDKHFVADIHAVAAFAHTKLFQDSRRGNAATSLLEVPAHRLGHILQLQWLLIHQTELHRVVSVRTGGRFLLHHDTWASFDYRHWRHRAVRRKDLRHADFSSDDPVNHFRLSLLPIIEWPGKARHRTVRHHHRPPRKARHPRRNSASICLRRPNGSRRDRRGRCCNRS